MAPCGSVSGAVLPSMSPLTSTAARKQSQNANPRGTRSGLARRSCSAIGRLKPMIAKLPRPSAHQTGKNATSAVNGQCAGSRIPRERSARLSHGPLRCTA